MRPSGCTGGAGEGKRVGRGQGRDMEVAVEEVELDLIEEPRATGAWRSDRSDSFAYRGWGGRGTPTPCPMGFLIEEATPTAVIAAP